MGEFSGTGTELGKNKIEQAVIRKRGKKGAGDMKRLKL
jgi:hypothetical protein